MKILVEVKSVYGKELIYPACEKAQSFATLAGKKTLDRRDLALIHSLGFAIEQKLTHQLPSFN